jgi:hypothetical protein
MGKKRAKFRPPKADKQELEEFREHLRIMDDKSKAISEKYKKWWDSDKRNWKKDFDGH